jgi:outer membrane protein TolC
MTEVLDADERAFTAEKNLSAATARYVFAALQLQASIGELTAQSMPEVFRGTP